MNPTVIPAQLAGMASPPSPTARSSSRGPQAGVNCQAAGFSDMLAVLLAAVVPVAALDRVPAGAGQAVETTEAGGAGKGTPAGMPPVAAEGADAGPAWPIGSNAAFGAGCDPDLAGLFAGNAGIAAQDAQAVREPLGGIGIPGFLKVGIDEGPVASAIASPSGAQSTRSSLNLVETSFKDALVARLETYPADGGRVAQGTGPSLQPTPELAAERELPAALRERGSTRRAHSAAVSANDGGGKVLKALWASATQYGLEPAAALRVGGRAAASPLDGQAAAADGAAAPGAADGPRAAGVVAGHTGTGEAGGGLGAEAGRAQGFQTESGAAGAGAPDAAQARPKFDSALADAVGASQAPAGVARPADAPARPPTPPASQPQQAVFDAIADRVEVARAKGENLARFELVTGDGNAIRVRISVHDNSVSARIGVTSEAMKDVLAGHMSELSQRLEAGGLATETIQVSMLGEWQTGAGRHDREQANRPRTGRHEEQANDLTLIETDDDGFEKWA